MNRNCHTYLLILSKVSIDDPKIEGQINPKATSLNCLDFALIYDDEFSQNCETTTLHAVAEHCKAILAALAQELAPPSKSVAINCRQLQILKYFDYLCDDDDGNDLTSLQSALDATPFRELIIKSIPVNKICVKAEQILCYQRLRYPCTEYLYFAHTFIDGVPIFKQQSKVLSKC